MKLLVINGPNLNMLGIREPEIYGNQTLHDLENLMNEKAKELGILLTFFQSNHEGAIVDAIQGAYQNFDGIIINPAAYTHTAVSILDALKAVGLPTVEVHLSDPDTREDFRKISYIRPYCLCTIKGHGFCGYIEAMTCLYDFIQGAQK